MASFCTRCGAPVSGAFCTSCGQPAQPAANPATAPPSAPAAGSSSPVLKIVLVVVALIVVLGVVSVAGVIYAGYRMKQRAERVAREYGIELSSRPRTSPGATRHRDGCLLLTKDEVQSLFGVEIERAVSAPDGESCTWFASPEGAQKRQEEARKALENLQSRGDKDPSGGLKAVEQLTKGIVGAAATAQGNPQVISITVDREDGKAKAAGIGIFAAWASGMPSGGGMSKIEGLGDRAMFGPMNSMLYVLQGDTMLQMDLRATPAGREQAIEAARKILSRL